MPTLSSSSPPHSSQTASSNSHIQEERGQKLEDSSLGEEDK